MKTEAKYKQRFEQLDLLRDTLVKHKGYSDIDAMLTMGEHFEITAMYMIERLSLRLFAESSG